MIRFFQTAAAAAIIATAFVAAPAGAESLTHAEMADMMADFAAVSQQNNADEAGESHRNSVSDWNPKQQWTAAAVDFDKDC